MNKIAFIALLFVMLLPLRANSEVRVIEPTIVCDMIEASDKDIETALDYLYSGDSITSPKIKALAAKISGNDIIEHCYGTGCSWYCGGEVDTITASSSLPPIKNFDYKPANAHDFSFEKVWAEGVKGYGIGEYIQYFFKGNCPRITTVYILNGHVKNEKAWRNNSRVKSLMMYYNDEPYAILKLNDTRSLQSYDVGLLGYHDPKAPEWSLKFEILEVYPGERYDDTVISELFFTGIDVH